MSLFKKIPPTRWIELVVDGDLLNSECGYIQYEAREPGSIEHVLNALAFSIENRRTPLSTKHIKVLHTHVLEGVKGLFERATSRVGKVRAAQAASNFLISKQRFSREGLAEFLTSYREGITNAKLRSPEGVDYLAKDSKYTVEEIFNTTEDFIYVTPSYNTEEELEAVLDRLAQDYNREIATCKPEHKLFVIVKYIQCFARLHPFHDGNGRTFINVLLNTLLINNNFYPAIFFNPNICELYSVEQLVNVVIEAMWCFEYIALNPDKPLFYDHTSLSVSEKTWLSAISEKLIHAINSITDVDQFISPSELLKDQKHLNLLHVVTGDLDKLQLRPSDEIAFLLDERSFGPADTSLLIKNKHAVHLAARFGHIKTLEWMLKEKPKLVYLSNCEEKTPLHIAAEFSNLRTITVLLNAGAAANEEQEDPSISAAANRRKDVFLFMSRGKLQHNEFAGILFLRWLTRALISINSEILSQLFNWIDTYPDLIPKIKWRLSIQVEKKYFIKAVGVLASEFHPQLLERLLKVGSSLFPPYLNSSVLDKAVIWTKKETFFLLVKYGLQPSPRTLSIILSSTSDVEWFMRTIQLSCVKKEMLNHFSLLKQVIKKYSKEDAILILLLEKGLNPFLLDNDGSSILHNISSDEINFLHLLQKQGKLTLNELERLNNFGATPFMRAKERGEEHLVRFFSEQTSTDKKNLPKPIGTDEFGIFSSATTDNPGNSTGSLVRFAFV